MCGIYGSIERAGNAPTIVFSGLKDIEYRGYDSWGITYLQDSRFIVVKEIGFLPKKIYLPQSTIALGHTRWATNGRVTKENAHPHTDCKRSIILVHNGIVENADELKSRLSHHHFASETDSEVIAHLIEDERERTNHPFSESIRAVFERLNGSNALLVSDGKELVATQKGSSLVVGKTPGGVIVSSDANSILPHTKELHFMENDEIAIMREDYQNIPFCTVDWNYQSGDLGEYPYHMIKEITEQPQTLDQLLKEPEQIKNAVSAIREARNIFLLGCGSASYAGLTGDYLLSEYGNRLVYCCAASEFSNKQVQLQPEDLVISISQSGETIDLLEQVRKSQRKGVQQLAIVNSFGSTLYREIPARVMLNAGVEKAVVATKSFTNMIAVFILISHGLGRSYDQGEKTVAKSINATLAVLEKQREIQEIAKTIANEKHLFVLGKGMSYPIALEIALKMKEASYLHGEGFQSGELKHGVLALIEEGIPVIALTTVGKDREDILINVSEIKARGAKIVGIGTQDNHLFDMHFSIPDVGADAIIPKAVFGQLLSYYTALERGLNPDKPRNLAKSVTVK